MMVLKVHSTLVLILNFMKQPIPRFTTEEIMVTFHLEEVVQANGLLPQFLQLDFSLIPLQQVGLTEDFVHDKMLILEFIIKLLAM